MRGSFRIARAFGIDIRVHVTFFLILLWGAIAGASGGAVGMLYGVLFITLLFVCVVLHELGHSVVALQFGIPVRDITLLPIGGVASLGRSSEKPVQELLIALAGPAVNVVIAVGLLVLLGATRTLPRTQEDFAAFFAGGPSVHRMLVQLLTANIFLVLFNMLPAFPLDGGRVLRAVLAMVLPRARATRIAASIGQIAAVGLGILGAMTGNWMLVFVAVFVFFAAGAETAQAYAHNVLQTRRVGDAYNRTAIALSLDDRVSRVVDHILNSYQPDFAVLHRGQLQGVITREDVLRWLAANAYDVYVTEVMHENVPHVQAHQTLDEVRTSLAEAGQRVAAVFEGEHYLGLVSIEDIDEAMAVLGFLQRTVPPGRTPGPRSVAAAVQGQDPVPAIPPEAGVMGDAPRG